MPWKNGGGETIEMMVSPAEASFETFDWRISMAHVAVPGPFSLFPNIDRTLSVIEGAGITLALADEDSVSLNWRSEPFRFAGDVAVESLLTAGPIDDLNVMTRRGRCDHRVSRHPVATPTKIGWQGHIGIVVAIDGSVDVRTEQDRFTLGPKDAMIFSAGDAQEFTASSPSDADLFLIEIWNA
ncbi:HutD family protein [Bradyrhizobium sp. Ash2021]|uniref:HutD/Ves family protein n=1 Tax=Bradyrhizobium sp. Ash2021 TaxID=2954771 RepID=UPI0028149AC1|nr:HutD family protein [Bradyrhizobium sp. Ash2021]WMT75965.1 HutD family protein [Bradyrhizobium sp. Ash2021]